MNSLRDKFPHKRFRRSIQKAFTTNSLKLSIHVPRVLQTVIGVLLDKMVQIDADITDETEEDGSDDDSDSGDDADPTVGIFTADDDVVVMDATENEPQASESGSDDTAENEEEVDEDAPESKLDAMMGLMFEFIRTRLADEEDPSTASNLFDILWREFVRVVLPTHRSKHTQYLLFYLAR